MPVSMIASRAQVQVETLGTAPAYPHDGQSTTRVAEHAAVRDTCRTHSLGKQRHHHLCTNGAKFLSDCIRIKLTCGCAVEHPQVVCVGAPVVLNVPVVPYDSYLSGTLEGAYRAKTALSTILPGPLPVWSTDHPRPHHPCCSFGFRFTRHVANCRPTSLCVFHRSLRLLVFGRSVLHVT